MQKNIFKVNFIRLRNNENTYGFVRAFTVDEAKQIIINEIAQGNSSFIKITSVKMVSEKEFEDTMNS